MYYQRLGAFGCFDQCFNMVAGYFMLKGRLLYSQIFFNHQPLMAFVSYLIQLILHPNSLYQLILYHRLFIFAFSLMMDLLLIWRFKLKGFLFVLFFETFKYYFFGHLFLPESLVVYFLVYLSGLSFEKLRKRPLGCIDYLMAAIFAWAVIFLREPYIPAAIFLYIFIIWNKKEFKEKIRSGIIFLILTVVILVPLISSDYIFDIFTANFKTISEEARGVGLIGLGLFKPFYYPFYLLFNGKWNYLHRILIGFDLIFLIAALMTYSRKRSWIFLAFPFLVLGLAAIRLVEPGTMFYSSFYMLGWFGLFLFFTLSFVFVLGKPIILILGLVAIFLSAIFSPYFFLWEKVDRGEEFTTNYAHYFVYGNVIKSLSKPGQTVFLDVWDDLIYWQTGLDSSYPYALYTPVMSSFPGFQNLRLEMFQKNKPDFYYCDCPRADSEPFLPKKEQNYYSRFLFDHRPTCLFIKKTLIQTIEKSQWEQINNELGFYLSPEQ